MSFEDELLVDGVDKMFVEYYGNPLVMTELGYKFRVLREDVHCNGCKQKIKKHDIGYVSRDHYVYHPECRKKKVIAEI